MRKNNIILEILLLVIGLVIGIGVGYVINKDNENTNDDNSNVNNNQNINDKVETDENMDEDLLTVTDFFDQKCYVENADDCNEAIDEKFSLNLINNYRHEEENGVLMYDLSEDMKNNIAAINATGKTALCQDYFDLRMSNCYEDDEIKIIKYEDLLKMKKKLFGETSTLEKKKFYTNPIGYFEYFSNIDSFVFGGYEPKGGQSSDVVGVIRSESSKDHLYLVAYEITSGVGYNAAGVLGYTFKKENNNFYLKEITRLRFD